MSDWWAKKLGGGAPQPRQDPAPTPHAIPPHQRPMAPVPQQFAPEGVVVQQPPAPSNESPDGQSLSETLMTKTYNEVPHQAKALRNSGGTCPECGSGNYLKTERHQHCHDCGYPIIQAGSGTGTLGGAGIIATGGTHQAQSPTYDQQLGG